jgi:hypothetical protein
MVRQAPDQRFEPFGQEERKNKRSGIEQAIGVEN